MRIKKNDIVEVIAGKDKGKQGKVLRTISKKDRVVIEGANMRTKHFKKTAERAGQKVEFEAPMHISNVMIVDPKTKKPTRIGYIKDKNNRKVRVSKKSGEVLDGKTAKVTKPAVKSEADKVKATKEKKSN